MLKLLIPRILTINLKNRLYSNYSYHHSDNKILKQIEKDQKDILEIRKEFIEKHKQYQCHRVSKNNEIVKTPYYKYIPLIYQPIKKLTY
jgi:hypothetical protein